jgi:choline-sulfatase
LAEYAAEGSVAPMVMIRDQDWKFNYCEADPIQLFNLSEDPLELNNLASAGEHQGLVNEFLEQVRQHWNIKEFEQSVIRSQRNRHIVYAGLRQGKFASWDWQPNQDAKERYMRNHLDLNEVEAGARFPKGK